jgi:hypothetical protein
MLRTIVDVDPEEWIALWSRRWQMYLDGILPDRYHDDAERWARLDALRSRATFFVDAQHAPEVLRLIARYGIIIIITSAHFSHILPPPRRSLNRPSALDDHMKFQKSSTLYPPDRTMMGYKGNIPFGCHLFLPGPEGDELARLVFSGVRSPLLPDADELVAFWYDSRHSGYDDIDFMTTPFIEPIRR